MSDVIRKLEQQARWVVPEGYEVVKTQQRVGLLLTRCTKRGCEKYVKTLMEHFGDIPMLRYEVERRSRFIWDVVAYQNVLHRREGADDGDCGCA